MKGYIYVLTNPAMPGLVKIGRSIHGGRKRAMQLDGTAVPIPFEVEFEMMFEYVGEAEPLIHSRLSKYRINKSREFFCVSPEFAQEHVVAVWLQVRDMAISLVDEAAALHMAKELAAGTPLTGFELINAFAAFSTQEQISDLCERYQRLIARGFELEEVH